MTRSARDAAIEAAAREVQASMLDHDDPGVRYFRAQDALTAALALPVDPPPSVAEQKQAAWTRRVARRITKAVEHRCFLTAASALGAASGVVPDSAAAAIHRIRHDSLSVHDQPFDAMLYLTEEPIPSSRPSEVERAERAVVEAALPYVGILTSGRNHWPEGSPARRIVDAVNALRDACEKAGR